MDTIWDAQSDTWHYNAIHFATYINSSSVKVYESDPTIGVSDDNVAVNRGTISSTSTDDDIFEIRVIGYTVEYVKNGEVYYTSTNNAVFPLYVKACIYSDGFKNIELFKDRYPLRRVEWDENYSEKVHINNLRDIKRIVGDDTVVYGTQMHYPYKILKEMIIYGRVYVFNQYAKREKIDVCLD